MKVRSLWDGSTTTCPKCGGDDWDDEGRTLDYFRYRCSNPECRHAISPYTETGMSR